VKKILSPETLVNRPDVNGKDAFGSTALHEASFFGHDDIVRLLIKAGAHVLARDTDGGTALHKVRIIEQRKIFQSFLFQAAAGNRPSTLLILISEGHADFEERNYTNHWVPLHEAAFHNSTACVQVLLDCGAPCRPRTDQGKTPLELAEEVKSEESISLLREYKVPPAQSRRVDWLHDQSTFDRLAAKQLIESIKNGPRNGMFVVRHSSKNAKNYALTLYNDNEFFNYEIIRLNDTTYYIDDGPYFDSLDHLIDHYCRIPDGLPTTLICSINRFGQIVNSRVQPFSLSSVNNKSKGKS
jgi:tyrosine-protein kinase